MPTTKTCCCNCPTKAEAGLPDSLIANYSVQSSSSTGLPANQDIGVCDGGNVQFQFEHDEDRALINLLSTITYDFVESVSSGCDSTCCFRYEGRTNYTPECPPGPDGILLGTSPFAPRAVGEEFAMDLFTGTDQNPPEPGCGDPGWICDCCDCNHNLPCSAIGTASVLWSGDLFESRNVFGTASLLICIQGGVVTICETIAFKVECWLRSGSGNIQYGPFRDVCGPDEVCPPPVNENIESVTATEGCTDNTSSTVFLTATADLSAVSGADIWEKIKNAPAGAWESDYESVHCNCGTPGCVDDYTLVTHLNCYINSITCISEATDGETEVSGPDLPSHIDCLYAVGTIDRNYTDE